MDAKQARWYLAGLIDGEGHVHCALSQRQIVISNTDRSIIARAIECCQILNYHHRFRLAGYTKANNEYWEVVISKRETMERVVNELPLASENKLVLFDEIANQYSQMDPYRPELTSDEVKDIRSRKKTGRFYAKKYNRSPTVISYIQNGKRYKGVSERGR